MWSGFSGRWTLWDASRAAFSSLALLLVGLAVLVWGG